jgi:hypothetical protein
VILPSIENSIVFIDEENDFLRTMEFAEAIQHSMVVPLSRPQFEKNA